jgi:hypothetical protein
VYGMSWSFEAARRLSFFTFGLPQWLKLFALLGYHCCL